MFVPPQNKYAYIFVRVYINIYIYIYQNLGHYKQSQNLLRSQLLHCSVRYILSWFLHSCFYAPFILHVFHIFYTLLVQGVL